MDIVRFNVPLDTA